MWVNKFRTCSITSCARLASLLRSLAAPSTQEQTTNNLFSFLRDAHDRRRSFGNAWSPEKTSYLSANARGRKPFEYLVSVGVPGSRYLTEDQ
jgi:hypothetical protein